MDRYYTTYVRRLSLAIFCVVLSGCVGHLYFIPYREAGAGIGSNKVGNEVTLVKGQEARSVSGAIVRALQALQYSVIEPQDLVTNDIKVGQRWKSNVLPVDHNVIAEHNRLYPDRSLTSGYIWEIQYSGQFTIRDNTITLEIEPTLFENGARAGPEFRHETHSIYSADFFSKPLCTEIMTQLNSNKGCPR